MLNTGTGVFVHFPGENEQRVLHAASVIEMSGGGYVIRLEEPAAPTPAPGDEIVVFFNDRKEFMQQPARVNAIQANGDQPVFAIELVGEPVSAESRQCYRVGSAAAGLEATVDGEQGCVVIDVSQTGMSVMCKRIHRVGDVLGVALEFNGESWTGAARVQGGRELANGRVRYGLHCPRESREAGDLPKGLQKISSTLQRQHLRRLAGAG